jgi:hypothetical protein
MRLHWLESVLLGGTVAGSLHPQNESILMTYIKNQTGNRHSVNGLDPL